MIYQLLTLAFFLMSQGAQADGAPAGVSHKDVRCELVRIINNTQHEAILIKVLQKTKNGTDCSLVKILPEARRAIYGVKLPFVSVRSPQLHRAYLRNEPYAPDEAIRIKCGDYEYLLWINEHGIMCAKRELHDGPAKPVVLRALEPAIISCALILTLREQGQLIVDIQK